MFQKKYNTPVVVFRQTPDGFTKTNTMAMFTLIRGNRRLRLKSGLLINADSTSKVGNTYFTFTPDEKVYFPVKFNLLSTEIIKKIKKYEDEHIAELERIDADTTKSVEEKEEEKKNLLKQALTAEEKALLDKAAISFDIMPDPAAYEIAQQQIEEANRIRTMKKKDKWDKLMPILTIVGISIAFAIMAYATVNYASTMAKDMAPIASSLQSVSANLKGLIASLGTSTAHAVNSSIPAP